MGEQDRFTDEFKRDAVAQVVERGHAVSEVAERLGISTKSLYTWKALFSKPVRGRNTETDLAAELRRVKKELVRVIEERDIQKKAAVGSSGQRNLFGLRCSERTHHDGTNRSPWLVSRAEG
jgi:transposase